MNWEISMCYGILSNIILTDGGVGGNYQIRPNISGRMIAVYGTPFDPDGGAAI